jgi:hypothetical protein
MKRVIQVRIYVSPRQRKFMKGASHTIKMIPPDETLEDKWMFAMGK